MPLDLTGQSIAITGASSGIGEATALACARAGASVALAARRADRLETLAARIRDEGGSAVALPTDVADERQARAFVEHAYEEFGRLDGLINNAGVMLLGPVEGADTDEWRRMVDVNVLGLLYCTHAALPVMKRNSDPAGGHIVNVSSVAGRMSAPLMGWYCASKHALEAVTDALRMEVEADGVRVVLIEPGMVGTDIWSAARDGGFPQPTTARYAAAYARAEAIARRGSDRLPDPVWVARTIRVALANPVPLARYVVGPDAVGGILTETFAPTVVSDYVKAVGSGLRRLPVKIPFLG